LIWSERIIERTFGGAHQAIRSICSENPLTACSVKARAVAGGTATEAVREQIANGKSLIAYRE
jgi:hypothetical protein